MRDLKNSRVMLVISLALVLAAAALLAVSCGSSGGDATSSSTSTSAQSSSTTQGKFQSASQIESTLRQMDSEMNSVSPNDFNESQLSNSALGI